MVDSLAAAKPREHLILFRSMVVRDDQVDVLADGFGSRVSEERLGASIPRSDHAVQRLADDGVVRGVDDCRQQRSERIVLRDRDCGGSVVGLHGARAIDHT